MTAVCAITGPVFFCHHLAAHAESRDRIALIEQRIPAGVMRCPPSRGMVEDLLLVHDPAYIDRIASISSSDSDVSFLTPDTYVAPGTFETALHAAGTSVDAARRARAGTHAFALVRPPGHHATRDRAMGYCIFNNAAVAAARMLEDGCDRIAILDWDLHHGNGTQEIFYDSDRVLFCSVHLRGAFPGSGWVDEIGVGDGKGYAANLPLTPSTTDEVYLWAFDQIVPPLIEAYDPEIVVAQLGVDSHFADPLAHLILTSRGFTALVERILGFGRPVVAFGGGGYNLTAVPRLWTLAYSLMAEREIDDLIPAEYAAEHGVTHLHDTIQPPMTRHQRHNVRPDAEKAVASIKRLIFPVHGLNTSP